MISIWVTKGQGHCISFLSCIYTGKCLTRPQYTGLAMVSEVDAGGLYKYCHLLISPCYLSNSIYKHFAGGNNAENILLSQKRLSGTGVSCH